MDYDLWKHTDLYLTRTPFAERPHSQLYYPSESSVKIRDTVNERDIIEGKCMRAAWFRVKNTEGIAHSAGTQYKFGLGNIVEAWLIRTWKEMGIWVDDHVRFKVPEYKVSGEIDVILQEPDGVLYAAEVKTIYGYYAEKDVFGNKSTQGKPRISHLLQTLIYLYNYRDKLDHAKLAYISRGNGDRIQFKIQLSEEVRTSADSYIGDQNLIINSDTIPDVVHYPMINGVVDKTFCVQDIFQRYKELDHYVERDEAPPREFDLYYDDATIELKYKLGEIAKTTYEKFKKARNTDAARIGDWNCSYCTYKHICYGD
jgi:CRISPR/Cas system-associated exonuclease Cas4 (RecB family)